MTSLTCVRQMLLLEVTLAESSIDACVCVCYAIDSSTPELSTAFAMEAKFQISPVMLFSDFKLHNKVVKDIRDLVSTANAVDSPEVEESMVMRSWPSMRI